MRYPAYLTPNGRSCRHFYRRSQGRDAREPETPRNPQCDLLRATQRLRLAYAATGFPPFRQSSITSASGARMEPEKIHEVLRDRLRVQEGREVSPERGDSGQPDREDDGKGGPRGYD